MLPNYGRGRPIDINVVGRAWTAIRFSLLENRPYVRFWDEDNSRSREILSFLDDQLVGWSLRVFSQWFPVQR